MNIIGIVAEYNPFHNGHKYQIDKIKEMYPDSILIACVSSHFTQRGEISIIDKWNKTKFALNNSIDIVIENPFVFSTESADSFAHSSITLLNALKIDTLVFGSETNDTDLFKQLANTSNSDEYNNLVKEYLDKGNNYPTALSSALKKLTGKTITEPNDLLAISYTKEIIKQKKDINIVSIKRTNDYHDTISNDEIISASNIRNKLLNNNDIKKYVPNNIYTYIKDLRIDNSKLFELLKYKIITDNNLSSYLTVDEGIENRLIKYIYSSNSYEEFIEKIKTKRYTYNKLNRMFIHILVGLTKQDRNSIKTPSYIRILGLSSKGKKYINSIKKQITLPILSKFISDNKLLDYELKATSVYALLVNKPELIEEEYKNKIIIVD